MHPINSTNTKKRLFCRNATVTSIITMIALDSLLLAYSKPAAINNTIDTALISFGLLAILEYCTGSLSKLGTPHGDSRRLLRSGLLSFFLSATLVQTIAKTELK